jgi:hypothetical protein
MAASGSPGPRRLARALRRLDGSRDLVIQLAEGRAPACSPCRREPAHSQGRGRARPVAPRARPHRRAALRRHPCNWRRLGAVRANAGAALPADVKNASHRITRRVLRNWRPSPPSRRRAPWVRKDDLRSLRARNKHQARGRAAIGEDRTRPPAAACLAAARPSCPACRAAIAGVALPEAPLMKASRRALCAQQVQPTLEHRPIEAVAADSLVRLVLAGESLRQSRLHGN